MDKAALHAIDCKVGQKIREARSLLNMSQEKLAEEMNLTFQQIQKYEKGINRVSASRIYQLAQILEKPVSYFFDEPMIKWQEKRPADFAKWINLYELLDPDFRKSLYKLINQNSSPPI